ncbi:hypothetical protein FRC10_009895 [Ceratobasidium sp. 414]|nr:hypothetical protein FRC10_009895 [Ceratobasidium sp. 414]
MNQLTGPTVNPPPSAPPSRALPYPPTFFGAASSAGPGSADPKSPMSPNAWDSPKFSYGGQATGRPLWPMATPGLHGYFPSSNYNNPPSHFVPTGILSSPLPPLSFPDPFANTRSAHPVYTPQGPTTLPQDSDVPDTASSVYSSNYGGVSAPEVSRAPSLSGSAFDASRHSQPPVTTPIFSVNQSVTPLPLLAPLFLEPYQLATALEKDRSRHPWENWEHQFLLYNLVGPEAPPGLIRYLVLPRKRSELTSLKCWRQLSEGVFNRTRTPGAILRQWLALRDTYGEIVQFAERTGLDLSSPRFEDPQAFVNAVIVAWKTNVGLSATWDTAGKPKPSAVAAWTHDPVNGWLAMLYQRLKEENAVLPEEAPDAPTPNASQPPSAHSSTDGHTGAPPSVCAAPQHRTHTVAPSPITIIPPPGQDDLISLSRRSNGPARSSQSPVEPTPEDLASVESDAASASALRGHPRGREMLREQRAAALAAKADYIHSLALRIRTQTLGYLLGLEQQEREKRLQIAMNTIHAYEPMSVNRVSAESWVSRTFFTTHPSDDFTRLVDAWKAKLDVAPAHLTYNHSLDRAFTTPPLPSPGSPDPFGWEA